MNNASHRIPLVAGFAVFTPLLIAAVALSALPVAANQDAGSGRDSAVIDLGRPASADAAPDIAASRQIVAQARDSSADATGASERSAMLAPLEPYDLERPARLVGDVQSAEFLLVMPAEARPEALLIAYRSSIDVLPEESEITVFVNGATLTPFRPSVTDAFAMVDLPADALQAGKNRIRIEARHHHRIYCGAEASFGLWTEIDLKRSGVRLSGDALRLGGAGLRAALVAQAAEGDPVEVRYGPDIDRSAAELAFRSVASATKGLFLQPRLLSVWASASAENARARITLLKGPADRVQLARGGDGALVLLIVMASQDVAWVAAEVKDLLDPGVSRPAPFALEPSAGASLADIGGKPEFALEGRYDAETFRFTLPKDWLAPPSSRATLTLSYAFSPSYTVGSFMTVELNGQPVQSLPLDAEVPPAQPLEIRFDPAILRRGVNTLGFTVLSPGDPPGQPCPLGEPHPVTTISGETAIALPPSASMRLAGMAPTVLGLGGASLEVAQSGHDDFARIASFTALEPVIDFPQARLRVVSIDDLAHGDTVELGVTTADVGDALDRGRQALIEKAPPSDPVIRWADWRWLLWTLRNALESLDARPVENGAPLALWLNELSARAILLQPHRQAPGDLLMVLDRATDAASVARSLDRARISGRGPDGRVAVLTIGDEWRSWFAPYEPPELLQPLDPSNATNVMGAYASWAPEAFALGGLGTTWISAAIGVVLIRLMRRRNGR
jgi:hypothetical protein